jgi:hypothetical protein
MRYFYVRPEVAGGWGPNTVVDTSVHPPIVSYLHYEFSGWLGDVLLTRFPSFIVTKEAARKLLENRVTGIHFGYVEVTTSDIFKELHPGRRLPRFVWLQVVGHAGKDDFGIAANHGLVMSERALNILRRLQLTDALIAPYRLH